MSMPIIETDTRTDPLSDPTPTLPPPPAPAVMLPVDDAEWDAAASANSDALPDPIDTPTGNGKFCESCGIPLTGKQRRFCADHAKNKTSTSTSTSTRGRRSSWKDAARVETHLTDLIETVAGGLLFFPKDTPIHNDGDTLYHYGPRVAHELVVLADDDPRLRKILTRLAAPGKYGPLAIAVGGLALGLASNHGLLPAALATVMKEATKGGDLNT